VSEKCSAGAESAVMKYAQRMRTSVVCACMLLSLFTFVCVLPVYQKLHRSASISEYYQQLENTVDASLYGKRASGDLQALAVHRGLGESLDSTVHYRLIEQCIKGSSVPIHKVMDAGCGMGAAMLYFTRRHPWQVDGYTLGNSQFKFIKDHFAELQVFLSSYDEPKTNYDAIYAIESLWYSDWKQALHIWADRLAPGGRIAIIDDFASTDGAILDLDVQGYVAGWMLRAVSSVSALCAAHPQLQCVETRDLTNEYKVNENNYNNETPEKRNWQHQAEEGSYFRQKASLKGVLKYSFVCLQKRAAQH